MRSLRAALRPGDLFVSLWVDDDDLVVTVGDRDDIHDVVFADGRAAVRGATEFVALVGADSDLDAYVRGVAGPPPARLGELLTAVADVALPASAVAAACSGSYGRLVLFPDGVLAGVPLHLNLERAGARFPGGIVHAPSASAYVACAGKAAQAAPARAAVVVGDADDEELVAEAERAAAALPCEVVLARRQADLDALTEPVDIVYVASHGSAETAEDDWALLFDGGLLTAGDVYRGRLPIAPGALAVLSACDVGHVAPGPAHELEGFARALFYAGCANVVAARWPVLHEFASAIFGVTLASVAGAGASPAAALHDAVAAARGDPDLTRFIAGPEAEPFFWGPYVALGSG